ncbi:hypothetical protein TIFTF001_036101 [Ficus carica]|uniref:DUF4220 domain-containing protein n=1 Tax=Ficus carica TaxID=3494 RepID=A0AA88E6Z9_FICCA|nr:hypothetical protein TIFTF001_036100 [Ficus carica]GMN67036.1 hypothetical protein TIFTF001_036101 [Ficus carica]
MGEMGSASEYHHQPLTSGFPALARTLSTAVQKRPPLQVRLGHILARQLDRHRHHRTNHQEPWQPQHLFGLGLQFFSARYSFYLTTIRNNLWGPCILVFIGGSVKFAERTWAQRLASLDSFGETALPDQNPGPDYEEAAAEYSVLKSTQLSTGGGGGGGVGNSLSEAINSAAEGRDPKDLVMKELEVAHSLFERFKGLIVGFLISSKDRDSSRNYFNSQAPDNAFRLVEYERSFMYQVLHTQSIVIHTKFGYALCGISFFSTVGASLFFLFVDKSGFDDFEIVATSALFIGAIILDIISLVKLAFFDWILLALKDSQIIKHVPM